MNETIWIREQLEAGKTAEVIAYLRALEDEYMRHAEEMEASWEVVRELNSSPELVEEVAW